MFRFLVFGVAVVALASATRAEEPTQEQRINRLLDTLKSGQLEDQRKAARGLWDAIRDKGIGTLPPKDVVEALAEAMNHKSDSVRELVIEALVYVRHESAIPVFVKALDDKNPRVRALACNGFYQLGPKAKEAIPVLTAKIKEGTVAGFEALAAVAGKDAVPVILEAVKGGMLSDDARHAAVSVLARHPDPRAAELMGKLFDERKYILHAAIFFAQLGDDDSLRRLRTCLTILPPPGSGGPLSTPVSNASDVRKIAVQTLGKKKDKGSFETILKMVNDDPSVRVQTAAAVALGEYADRRAVPALVKALGQKDEGFSADGHTDGDLRRAAVRSLARIGTDEALAALYEGARDGPAKSQCVEFWVNTKEPKHLGVFLKHFDAKPLPDARLAAGIIQTLLRNQKPKELTAKEQTAAEEEFYKTVDDPTRFGPKADLSEGGKWMVRVSYSFPAEGFVTVHFGFRDINPRGFGHSYTVLYRKTGDRWKPLGKMDGPRQ